MSWVIVKPEGAILFKEEICRFLKINGFQVKRMTQGRDFNLLCQEIYSFSPKATQTIVKLQNKLRIQLFGFELSQKFIFLELEHDFIIDTVAQFELLNKLKKEYRQIHWDCHLDVSITENGISAPFHYSFFHVPDNSLTIVDREFKIIESFLFIKSNDL